MKQAHNYNNSRNLGARDKLIHYFHGSAWATINADFMIGTQVTLEIVYIREKLTDRPGQLKKNTMSTDAHQPREKLKGGGVVCRTPWGRPLPAASSPNPELLEKPGTVQRHPGLFHHFTQVRALTFPTAHEGELCPLFQVGNNEAQKN